MYLDNRPLVGGLRSQKHENRKKPCTLCHEQSTLAGGLPPSFISTLALTMASTCACSTSRSLWIVSLLFVLALARMEMMRPMLLVLLCLLRPLSRELFAAVWELLIWGTSDQQAARPRPRHVRGEQHERGNGPRPHKENKEQVPRERSKFSTNVARMRQPEGQW